MVSQSLSTHAEVQQYLEGLRLQGSSLGLMRAQNLAQRLGNPELRYPIVHVAGTNGKGSTCAMLEAVYRSAGYRVGLFTSPHLVRVNERIQVDRQLIRSDEMRALIQRLVNSSEAEKHAAFAAPVFQFAPDL